MGVEKFRRAVVPAGGIRGTVFERDYLFTERADPGIYTATMRIPAGLLLEHVVVLPLAAWAADTALLAMGDRAFAGEYADGLDVKALDAPEDQYIGGVYQADDVLTMTLTTTAATPATPTGQLLIRILHVQPIRAEPPVFAVAV